MDLAGRILEDSNGNIQWATGTTVPSDGSSGYAKGCIFIDTDAAATSVFYVNEGSATSADFNVINPAATSATAYDDIGDPDANGTIALAGYTATYTSTLNGGSVYTLSNTVADLTTDTRLLELKYTDDGDANGIFIRCLDNVGADVKFLVEADGKTTITGTASGTDALILTAGDILLTSGHLDLTSGNITVAAGTINIAADSQNLTLGASGATDSYIQFDGTNLLFYDSALGGTRTLTQLAGSGLSNPTVTGDLTISDGQFNWTDSTAEAAGVWSFQGTSTTDIAVTSQISTGKGISYIANSLTSGSIFYAESSAAGLTSGNYYAAHDGSGIVFEVGLYGAITVAGNASTDVLILTAGDIQITSGDIDMDAGIITIDNTADEGSKIARNNATGTAAVLEIEQTHATGGINLLLDTKNTTAGEYNLDMTSSGATHIHFTANGAAGDGMLVDVTDAHTGQIFKIDAGPWLGTAGEGAGFDFRSDSAATAEAGHVIYIKLQGTAADAAAIDGKGLYIEDEAASTAGSYLIKLDSLANGAIHVAKGASLFEGTLTVGVDATGYDVKFFGDTTAKFMVWDQSADDLILADGVALQLGGDESTADGFKLEFDGTATLALDALTANDSFTIGATTATDISIQGLTAGADINWDASANTLTVTAGAKLVVVGDATGDGTDGLEIPYHATASPSGAAGTGSIFFEVDAKKLWVYDGTTWVGTTLA